jgi:hypothetical protein
MKKAALKVLVLFAVLLFSACGEDLLIDLESVDVDSVSREEVVIIATLVKPDEPLSGESVIDKNTPEPEGGTGIPGDADTPEPDEPLSEEPVIDEPPPEEEGEVVINVIMAGAGGENTSQEAPPPEEEGEVTISVIMAGSGDENIPQEAPPPEEEGEVIIRIIMKGANDKNIPQEEPAPNSGRRAPKP